MQRCEKCGKITEGSVNNLSPEAQCLCTKEPEQEIKPCNEVKWTTKENALSYFSRVILVEDGYVYHICYNEEGEFTNIFRTQKDAFLLRWKPKPEPQWVAWDDESRKDIVIPVRRKSDWQDAVAIYFPTSHRWQVSTEDDGMEWSDSEMFRLYDRYNSDGTISPFGRKVE